MVYDHVDGLKPAPHDITTVQDRMNGYFKVCMQVCYIRVNKICVYFQLNEPFDILPYLYQNFDKKLMAGFTKHLAESEDCVLWQHV